MICIYPKVIFVEFALGNNLYILLQKVSLTNGERFYYLYKFHKIAFFANYSVQKRW